MTLTPGTRLGPYEIAAPLGAGGMGEVYRARDTRLDRTVAIKILPAAFSSEPDRRARFDREARAISSLTHPHICALYDVGRQDSVDFLVMEYLEGETLAARLERGPLPPDQVLRYGGEIASALSQAHRQGILHRDLKPGNVVLTKAGAKVLDFGLAKLRPRPGAGGLASGETATGTTALTGQGTLLGTLPYMAPEQLEGREADARSDIWAFGAVLYEMATGRKPFAGTSHASLVGAILKDVPPPIAALQPTAPPALDRLVRMCLAKDPQERWQDAHDLVSELQWIGETATPTPSAAWSRTRERFTWGVAAAALLLAAVLAARLAQRKEPPPQGEVRLQVIPPAALRRVSGITLSPDGTRLAFVGVAIDGKTHLWVRPLSSLEAGPLAGTEDAQGVPFWSPDSRSLAFFTTDELRRVDVSGGPIRTLSDAPVFGRLRRSGAWNREGVVIFTHGDGPSVYRVSASGGAVAPVTRLDKARGEARHGSPEFLPDGRHFLYFAGSDEPEHRRFHVGSLDSAETRPLPRIETSASYASYAWPGYLLLRRGRALTAQPFDAMRLTLSGEPFVVAETVDDGGFSASETGALAFLSSGPETVQPSWIDRGGRPLGTVGEPGPYLQISLSPDGRQAAVQKVDPRLETSDIWLLDLARGVLSRFTFDAGTEGDPVWSPDGRRLAFSAVGEDRGRLAIYLKELGGASEERVLPESAQRAFVEAWSRDGRFLFYGAGNAGRDGLWAIPLLEGRKPFPVVQSPFLKDEPQLSPDGRFLAYMSNESGRYEVYVQAFPGPGPRVRLSTGGGAQPRWRGDGRELFYLAPAGALMAVDIKAGATLELGVPRKLFSTTLAVDHPTLDQYAVTADGERFLVLVPVGDAGSSPITVVLNWTAGLKK